MLKRTRYNSFITQRVAMFCMVLVLAVSPTSTSCSNISENTSQSVPTNENGEEDKTTRLHR